MSPPDTTISLNNTAIQAIAKLETLETGVAFPSYSSHKSIFPLSMGLLDLISKVCLDLVNFYHFHCHNLRLTQCPFIAQPLEIASISHSLPFTTPTNYEAHWLECHLKESWHWNGWGCRNKILQLVLWNQGSALPPLAAPGEQGTSSERANRRWSTSCWGRTFGCTTEDH